MLAALLLAAVAASRVVQSAPVRLTVGPPQPPFGRRNILDPDGRQRLLRGVNIGVQWWARDGRPTDPSRYADGKCPPVNATTDKLNWRQPPVCGVDAGKGKWNQSTAPLALNDLAEIRALGFNTVRLAIGWASLEPEPGKVSTQYIDRIAQVVEWAAEQDIWVFIDLHQDGYSFFMPDLNGGGWNDGAPEFACPPLSAYNDSSIISEAEVKLVEKALGGPVPKSFFATEGFYQNRPPTGFPTMGIGLQEHYIKAAAEVIKRFKGNPTVIGYEIQNEPMPGSQIDIYAFSKYTLYPFYKRFIQAVTGVRDGLPECDAEDPFPVCNKPPKECPKSAACAVPDLGVHDDKIYLFEPCVTRNSMDFSMQHFTKPWTEYENLIFAPHQYTGVFTAGRGYNKSDPSCCQPPFNKSLDTAWAEAKPMNASVMVTEWGSGDSGGDMSNLEGTTTQQDLQFTSTTYWDWKQNGCGAWPLYKCAAGKSQLRLMTFSPMYVAFSPTSQNLNCHWALKLAHLTPSFLPSFLPSYVT
jgi:hypothetical protein